MNTREKDNLFIIKNIIKNYIKYDSTILEIVPINYIGKSSIKDRILNTYEEDEIIGIVSTNNIDLNVPNYRLTDVLNLNVIPEIQEQVELKTTVYRMKYEIKKILKRVDGDTAYNEVKKLIRECEKDLKIKISLDKLIGVILHLCIMIDRLKAEEKIYEYPDKNLYLEENYELISFVREKLKGIEQTFNIKVNEDEIYYIVELLKEECRERVLEFLPKADILKISDDELQFITGIKEKDKAIKSLFKENVKVILYTKGGEGSEFITKDRVIKVDSEKVDVVDTTGAGDSFIGTVLCELSENNENFTLMTEDKVVEILRLASKCSAKVITRKGVITSVPSREELF